jgi:hypothetical protein
MLIDRTSLLKKAVFFHHIIHHISTCCYWSFKVLHKLPIILWIFWGLHSSIFQPSNIYSSAPAPCGAVHSAVAPLRPKAWLGKPRPLLQLLWALTFLTHLL